MGQAFLGSMAVARNACPGFYLESETSVSLLLFLSFF